MTPTTSKLVHTLAVTILMPSNLTGMLVKCLIALLGSGNHEQEEEKATDAQEADKGLTVIHFDTLLFLIGPHFLTKPYHILARSQVRKCGPVGYAAANCGIVALIVSHSPKKTSRRSSGVKTIPSLSASTFSSCAILVASRLIEKQRLSPVSG